MKHIYQTKPNQNKLILLSDKGNVKAKISLRRIGYHIIDKRKLYNDFEIK